MHIATLPTKPILYNTSSALLCSYFFINSFVDEHVSFHADALFKS